MCLAYDAGADPTAENITDMKLQAPSVRIYVQQLIGNDCNVKDTVIAVYISLIQQFLNAVGGKNTTNINAFNAEHPFPIIYSTPHTILTPYSPIKYGESLTSIYNSHYNLLFSHLIYTEHEFHKLKKR